MRKRLAIALGLALCLYGMAQAQTVIDPETAISDNTIQQGDNIIITPTEGGVIVGVDNSPTFDNVGATTITTGTLNTSGLINANSFILNTPVWDDYQISLISGRLLASAPAFTAVLGNIAAAEFVDNLDKCVPLGGQMPHRRVPASDMYLHVHWMPATTNTGNVEWYAECTNFIDVGESWSAVTKTYSTITNVPVASRYKHIVTGIANIPGASATGVSATGMCNLCRNTSTSGDMTGSVYGVSIDIHYEADRLGSPTEFSY